MELAGLNIVMDADFSAVFTAFNQAKAMTQSFASDIKGALSGIPDLGRRLNFTSNGASQAIQDQRELARAAREEAAAELDRARAQDIADRAAQRSIRTNAAAKDEYAQLVTKNQALVREYYNASAAIIRYGDAAGISAARLEELRKAAKDGQDQLQKIEQSVGRFQRNVGNYASGNAALAQQLKQITTELPNFFISARIGLQSLSNNLPGIFNELTRIREANQALAASGQPTVSVFKQFLASFNPLNIAIGVGVGLLTAYGPKLWDMIKGSENSAEAIKKQKQQQEELNQAEASALKTGADQIGTITLLEATMSNANLTMRQRTIAYNEAVKLYPAYLSNISKEEALNGGLADTIKNRLVPAIIAAAKARAYQEQINILTARNIQLELEQADNIRNKAAATADLTKKTNQYIQSAAKAGKDDANALYGLSGLQSAKNKTEDLTKAINQNSEARIKNNETILSLAKKAGEQTDKAGDLNPFKKEPKTKDYTDSLNNAQLKIKQAWYQINEENKKGFDKFSESLDFTQLELKPVYIPDASGNIQSYFYKNAKAIQEGIDKEAAVRNTELSVWEDSNRDYLNYLDQRQEILKRYNPINILRQYQLRALEAMASFRVAIAQSIADIVTGSVEAFGTALGNIGDADGIKNLFKSIGNIIGDQIIALGKQLVIAGGLMEAIWDAIAGLGIPTGGTAAIIIGLAAIAGGAALKAALNKQAKGVGKYADGGIAYGPTLGLFGEYSNAPSNPEVVAPLDKLQTILKNSGGGSREPVVMIPDVQLRGSDIYLSFKRYEKGYQR